MAIPKMLVWKAPSGILHLRATCSGAASRNDMRKIRITKDQFSKAVRCRCLQTFRTPDA
jgi:hypothetical protein